MRKSFSELGDTSQADSASKHMKSTASGGKPLVAMAQPSGALLYKNGFLVRKVHADSDGKRSMCQNHIHTFIALVKIYIILTTISHHRMCQTPYPLPILIAVYLLILLI